MFFSQFNEKKGWRILADYRAIGGDIIDICGAANEYVAIQTAMLLNRRDQMERG